MVNPIYIFILALGAGFLLTLFDKAGRKVSLTIFYVVLVAMVAISAQWLIALLGGSETAMIYTAGFKPPFSINLQMGLEEAIFTLAVNVLGCLVIGALMFLVEERQLFSSNMRLFLLIGLLGSFTTFSTVGYETFEFLRAGDYRMAVVNAGGNVLLGITAVLLGWIGMRAFGI